MTSGMWPRRRSRSTSQSDPAAPPLGSAAPYTGRVSRAVRPRPHTSCTVPASPRSVQPSSRQPPITRAACRIASILACAVGSPAASRRLRPRVTARPAGPAPRHPPAHRRPAPAASAPAASAARGGLGHASRIGGSKAATYPVPYIGHAAGTLGPRAESSARSIAWPKPSRPARLASTSSGNRSRSPDSAPSSISSTPRSVKIDRSPAGSTWSSSSSSGHRDIQMVEYLAGQRPVHGGGHVGQEDRHRVPRTRSARRSPHRPRRARSCRRHSAAVCAPGPSPRGHRSAPPEGLPPPRCPPPGRP